MKKSVVTLAMLCTFAGVTSAESSVTVYGNIDVGIVYEDGSVAAPLGEKTLKVTSGVAKSSRLGFRGVEDLGGGLKASFTLETGYCADGATDADPYCGADNQFMSRKAFVALDGGFGSVQLGRQDSASYSHQKAVDPFGNGLAGRMGNLFAAQKRLNNAIAYSLPSMGGFNATLAYAAGEKPGDTSASRLIDTAVSYTQGPFYVGLGYDKSYDSSGNAKVKIANIGATYDFGMAKGYLSYQTTKDDQPSGTKDENDILVGVSVPLGQGKLMASHIQHSDERNVPAPQDAHQTGIGYIYSMSKRTQLYTSYAKVSNDNGGTKKVGNDSESGSGDKAFNLGVLHSF